ncbi:YibE/F family protein [Nocardioides flavus (ex Wang et al. 2016)]
MRAAVPSALPLLILIVANSDSFGGVVTDQIIAQEIVRTVVATLGLIAAVPLTTALAALTASRTA